MVDQTAVRVVNAMERRHGSEQGHQAEWYRSRGVGSQRVVRHMAGGMAHQRLGTVGRMHPRPIRYRADGQRLLDGLQYKCLADNLGGCVAQWIAKSLMWSTSTWFMESTEYQ